jgi:uncharacterized delta-60 repeat protein
VRRLALVRYAANGTLDASFGQGGSVVSDLATGADGLALEPDASLLVLTSTRALRFSASGAPLPLALAGSLAAISRPDFTSVTFQNDGRIIHGGSAVGAFKRTRIVKMQRLLLDSTVDPSFNSPAFPFVTPQISASSHVVEAILVQPSGRIIVAGSAPLGLGLGTAFGVAAIQANGPLDTTFGNGGVLTTTFTSRDQATALLQQADGKIIAVGESGDSTGEHYSIALARYLP